MKLLLTYTVFVAAVQSATFAAANDELIQQGKDVYDSYCSQCHDENTVPDGRELAGPRALRYKYQGRMSPYIDRRADLADFKILEGYIRNGVFSMPPFRKTEVSDDDIAAIAAYIAENSAKK